MAEDHTRIALEGVLVRVPPAVPVQRTDGGAMRLRIPAIRPVLSPGFLLVDGSSGRPDGSAVARFYVRLSAPGQAVQVWKEALSSLEALTVRYRAKVASSAGMFPRADAMVVYCSAAAEAVVRDGLRETLEGRLEAGAMPSVFTEEIAPGLEFAEEPLENPGGELSFGQHRSRALAQGLIKGAREGWADAERTVADALRRHDIAPSQPWRNIR